MSAVQGGLWLAPLRGVTVRTFRSVFAGAIREAGFVKCGKTCGRVYEAAFTCEEYHVGTLDSTKCVPDPVKLVKAYLAVHKELLECEKVRALIGEE